MLNEFVDKDIIKDLEQKVDKILVQNGRSIEALSSDKIEKVKALNFLITGELVFPEKIEKDILKYQTAIENIIKKSGSIIPSDKMKLRQHLANETYFPSDQYDRVFNYLNIQCERTKDLFNNNSNIIDTAQMRDRYKVDKLSRSNMYNTSDKYSEQERKVLGAIDWDPLKTFIGSVTKIHQESQDSLYISNPFKDGEDKNYSMAMYYGNGYPTFIDFLDGNQSYDLLSFWMKLYDIPRSQALHEIITEFNIVMNNSEYSALSKLDAVSTVEGLIEKVDTENYVYYRNAQKRSSCIVRHIKTGQSYAFDGDAILADHVLINQLKCKNPDKETKTIFREQFSSMILIDAFEEFIPGADIVTHKEFFRIVNLWIPGDNYTDCHKLANELQFPEMDEKNEIQLEDAMGVFKNKTPFMYAYLKQITQKGSVDYFINWLACVANFRIMPTLPVLTSVQGSGKNLFIDEVMNYYLNQEYVNVVTSEKISNNFNAFMEKSSLVVLDEGDFSNTRDVDNLKLLTGNKSLQIEKKGIDSVKKDRTFNLVMLTNGEKPVKHNIGDRRITYFRLDIDLAETTHFMNLKDNSLPDGINSFIEEIRKEMKLFWAIVLKIKIDERWCTGNLKNGQYNKQILMMHPFGELLIKMLENNWDEIKLQLNEKVEDELTESSNTKMIDIIEDSFKGITRNESGDIISITDPDTALISLPIVNKYLKSLEFKTFLGIQQFIKMNKLDNKGIKTVYKNAKRKVQNDQGINEYKDVKLIFLQIEKNKILDMIYTPNNLEDLIPERFGENAEKILEALDKSKLKDVDLPLEQTDGIEYMDKNKMGKSPAEGYLSFLDDITKEEIRKADLSNTEIPPGMPGSTPNTTNTTNTQNVPNNTPSKIKMPGGMI